VRRLETLLIVSHVVHYRHNQQLYAYGPYAREIDVWADLFPRVIIAAPCREEPPPGDCLSFGRPNISIARQRETGGDTVAAKLRQLALLPSLVWGLACVMRRVDAIHVRCPGNLGLLGAILGPCFSESLVAKYAGQWNGYRGEPWTVRLQRVLLRSPWWRGPVTVYGTWPHQPRQVVPFFTSMMTRDQVERAVQIASSKTLCAPLRVLFSGRLEPVKRADALLAGVKIAVDAGVPIEVVILGDGSERRVLQTMAANLGINHLVTFAGAQPFDRALDWYAWAHCLVLPSQHSEGWPKVLAEAMCHGVLGVGVDHGQVRDMLANRGVLLENGTPAEIATALQEVAGNPSRYELLMQSGSAWARQFSLEGLRDAIRDLLVREWGVTFSTRLPQSSPTSQPVV